MTFKRKALGKVGEEFAVSFLQKKGYKIIETNYTIKNLGEIDIICKKKNKIIFIEVKTRTSNEFGTPEEAITPTKQQKLIYLAQAYLNIKKWQHREFAIDGVFIDIRDSEYEIRHLENMLEDF